MTSHFIVYLGKALTQGKYRNNPRPNHGIRRILPWFEVINPLKSLYTNILLSYPHFIVSNLCKDRDSCTLCTITAK